MQQRIYFDTAKGGNVPNFCLANVCKGYSIPNKYNSAWEAWLNTEQHTDAIPAGLDIPVFFSYTATIDGINKNWGHIGVRLKDGRFWSDGRIFPSIQSYESNHSPRYVGWGESINNITILEDNVNTRERVQAVFRAYLGKEATEQEISYWVGRPTTELDDNAASSRFAQDAKKIADLEAQLATEYEVINEPVYRKKA